MKIVILDGHTVVQDDLSWDGFGEMGEVTYYERTPQDMVTERIGDAEVVICSKCLISKEVMDAAANLKYIGVIATGYNNVDVEYAARKGITVTNIPSYSTDSVAQFAFSLILECANRVGVHSDSVRRGEWLNTTDFCYSLTPQIELAGKTLGIMGFGNIGKKVVELGKAFGMNVIVNSSHTKPGDEKDGIRFVTLDELFASSDVISLHCALTDKNKGIINKENLSAMKDSSILINTARGPLINEADLADALKKGEIAAAALDVLTKEPPEKISPLMELSNCIITPHIAWFTEESRKRLINIAVNNLRAYTSGNPQNTVL